MTQDEAEYVLKGIIDRERQRIQVQLTPYICELARIEIYKPPRPMQLPDGRWAIYSGPTTDQVAGPYQAPRWLEAMCRAVGAESDDLRRFRENAGRSTADGVDDEQN